MSTASLPKAYTALVAALDSLPNIGPNAAERLAQHLLLSGNLSTLQQALAQAQDSLELCATCQAIREKSHCSACQHAELAELLIVATVRQQQQALVSGFAGQVFVLHGLLSPVQGRGPKQLGLHKLQQLIEARSFTAIAVALDDSVEGRATVHFLQQWLSQLLGEAAPLHLTTWTQWQAQFAA